MKHRALIAALTIVFAAFPIVARSGESHQNMVMEHGAKVMPFDQQQAKHMFLPSAMGGVVEIVVHDMDPRQIELVRSHLLQEAGRFSRGDYLDPAYIHGMEMPGLAQLQGHAAGVSVRYFETPTGAAIVLASADNSMVSAIHQWLAAQQRDHNSSSAEYCDMQM